MLGTDTDFYDQLPVTDLKEYGQNDLLKVRRRSHAHHLETAFTGIVRGSIRPSELQFEGPWVRITELLSVFNQHTKSRRGVHEVLALIYQDNKQRFLIAGSEHWRMRHSRSLTANSRQALGRAGRCTITYAVSRSRTCPTKPESARIYPSKLCSKRPPSSATPTSLKQHPRAFCAGRKCRGARFSTLATPSRTRSCTPGPLRRRHLTLQNVWTTLAPRKCWPSPKALLQARIWQSFLRNRVRDLPPISSSHAPSARTTAAWASSIPNLCGI